MGQLEDSNKGRRNKHLNWEERIQIETLQREGYPAKKIGERIGRPARTIKRELDRGWLTHRTGKYSAEERYSADRGQTVHEERMRSKGRKPAMNTALSEHLHLHIVVHRYSPEGVAGLMKKNGFEHAICFKTIYNHIDQGLIPGVTNDSLWEKRQRRKGQKTLHRKRKRAVEPGGIEERPEEVEERLEPGHWEIDLVVGGKGKGSAVLLTLTERKTRKGIIRKLKDRTQASVTRAINGIERQMGKEAFKVVFKSITADNGSEFLDYEALERSVSGGSRTQVYYAHPYSFYALREKGFVVIGVNAKDAKKQRENMQASTDEFDLLGIATLLINRRGSTAGGTPGAERALDGFSHIFFSFPALDIPEEVVQDGLSLPA